MAVLSFSQICLTFAIVAISLSVSVLAEDNFRATYRSSPAPFKIDVRQGFIDETLRKVSLTRYNKDIEQPEFTEGPPKHNVTTVRDYWVKHYDWFKVQDYLNQRYHHFTTTVHTGPKSNFTEPVPLHFVHHRSNRTDAIPLIFLHGWPGSFMEVDHILDGLLNPPNASSPAFHVVAPSIPGFAFSPALQKPGFGPREAGFAFHALMQQLNYTRYVIQGGDLGAVILRFMAGDNPTAVVSVLSNFWLIPPNATDLERYAQGLTTKDENTMIANLNDYAANYSGYRLIQETRPLQLAIAMKDSPVGFAMWIYDLMHHVVDKYVWTPQEVITWSMMYYIQGPYGAFRLYRESAREGGGSILGIKYPYVHQPVAISEFPKDVWYGTPLDWAQREGNVVVRDVHYSGGHFAAHESPDLLLGDIRAFWGNASLSNVGVFG